MGDAAGRAVAANLAGAGHAMTSRRNPWLGVVRVAVWSMVAAVAGVIALFQNTPLLNRSVLASRVELDPARMSSWGGRAYSVPGIWLGLGDSERSVLSGITLYEDGVELPLARSKHADIRDKGGGAWSHWNRVILFSATDSSDPRTNGRRYSAIGLTLPVRLGSIVLALGACVMALLGVLRLMRARRIDPTPGAPISTDAASPVGTDAASPVGTDAASPVSTNAAAPAPTPSPRLRRLLLAGVSVGVSLLLVLLLLVGLELFLRWRAPPPVPSSLQLAEGVGWTRFGEPFRTIPSPQDASPNAFRVIFMGDSFTHARTWGDRSIDALRRQGIEAIGWECGVSGYGTTQELLALRKLITRFRPDAVVLQVYLWNDPRDNWPFPGICYNARMTQRPWMDEDGVVHEPSSWLIDLRRLQIWKELLEPVLDPMRSTHGKERIAAVGIDAIAEGRERMVIDYSTLESWAPLYQPSRQSGPYMQGAWKITELALRSVRDLCKAEGVAFAILGIDQAFTVEPAVAESSVPAQLRTGDDWDPLLPMRRLEAIAADLQVPLFDPMPALRNLHQSTGRPLHDGEGMGAHLLPESESVISDLVVPWLENVAKNQRAQRRR